MANGRTTKAAVEKEIRLAERRLKTIEKHTGAKLTLNKDAILSSPNRAKTVESLKNIKWSALKQGASFSKDFINMKVEGKYWTAKAGWIKTETEVQGKDAVQLLKAVAHREKITKTQQNISISGEDNIEKAIDWFNYYKTRQQYEKHLAKKNKIVAENFSSNLDDLIDSGKLTPEQIAKLKKLKKAIKKNPQKWAEIIKQKKLYDINGVNMFDSDDLAVDIADNYDVVMDAIEDNLLEDELFKQLDDEAKEEVMKEARRQATKEARKLAQKQAKELATLIDTII